MPTYHGNTPLEGLGGPVSMDPYSIGGIDPALDDCCRREVESNRRYNALTSTLKRHDVIAQAERRRRHLVSTKSWDGCRCCYDPNSDGGEYRALMDYKKAHPVTTHNSDSEVAKVDAEIKNDSESEEDEFDYLLDEDFETSGGAESNSWKEAEDARRAELEYQMLERQVAQQHGYGTHRQLHPTRVLKVAGLAGATAKRTPPPAVVLHLHDADTLASASLDYFLETELSQKYPGTIFCRSGGRSTLLMDAPLASKALPRLRTESDMPCLVAIRDGVVIAVAPQLREFLSGPDSSVEAHAVQAWLHNAGVLLERPPRMEELCHIRPEEEALMDYLATTRPNQAELDRFDCGVEGCNKTFFHEHVGISTSEQSGLMVKEDTILNEGGNVDGTGP